MAPLAASPATMALPSPPSGPPGGVAFKLQSKSAVALVNERRIEFVRAKKSALVVTKDKKLEPKKDKEILVPVGEIERLLQWQRTRKIGPGLANLGNTCYLNSVLQCLCYTPSFAQYLLQKDVSTRFGVHQSSSSKHGNTMRHATPGQGFCGARIMARLVQNMHSGANRVLQPKELVLNIRHVSKNFRIGRQEDSHEFFRLLLDALQRSSLRKAHIKQETHPAATTSFIHRMFGGKLKNTLKCAKCPYVSERFDDFLDLSLEISNGVSSVKGAIKHFTATETLDDSNAWRCASCQQLSRAEKGMTIDTCPNVLVVQLKRFDGMFGKIKKHIEFGTTLDLAVGMAKGAIDRTRGRSRYELHAVLVHAGFSTNCGHYYAFVKGSSGQWYEMNDETVRWVSVETVLQQKAYMLFYSRVLPPSEQPSPKEKPVKVKEVVPETTPKPTLAETIGEPVTPVVANGTAMNGTTKSPVANGTSKPAVANGTTKPTETLTMNYFLASLRTDLDASKQSVVSNGVPVANPKTVVTYKVSAPVKNRAMLKRRLVPVFAGALGRFVRYQARAWRATTGLHMTRNEDAPEETSVVSTAPVPTPPVTVEKVAFNPRELRGFGEKNSALYGRSIDQWNEDVDGGDSEVVAKHERVLQQLKAEDWAHRRAQRKSSWDEELDAGKTKKLKKRKAFIANEGKANAFQLALVQKKQKQ